MTEEPQTQINQGEIEVADNSEFDFDFDPDDEDLSLRSESDAAPTKRSFMWMWWVLAAVLFTTFAVFLSSASVGIVAHNQAQAQASVKESSGSKSGKSKCSKCSYARRIKDADFEDDEVVSNTDIVDRELDSFNDDDCEESDSNSNTEEPDGDAVRAKYEGTVDWETWTAEVRRRRRNACKHHCQRFCSNIGCSGGSGRGSGGKYPVAQVFEVLAVELSPDPYDWAAVIPDVTGYQLVGEGYCTSSLGEYYNAVQYTASSVLACVTKCKGSVCFAENSWTLAGVELEGSDCYCLINGGYESGDSCTDPDASFDDLGPGTGQPWFSGPDGQDDGALCFRLIQ
eukprot:scaffold3108_cov174-Skeletonema_marinoi.AAC.4